jgi:hypothetical protein
MPCCGVAVKDVHERNCGEWRGKIYVAGREMCMISETYGNESILPLGLTSHYVCEAKESDRNAGETGGMGHHKKIWPSSKIPLLKACH